MFKNLRLKCFYFAAGRGLCLAKDGGEDCRRTRDCLDRRSPTSSARISRLCTRSRLGGFPSRARVSPDGRDGAAHRFVSGHSYADGGFSTATLIDLGRRQKIGNLEKFAVFRDGKRIEAIDFNFWGVTFAQDSNRFYATLGTRGRPISSRATWRPPE